MICLHCKKPIDQNSEPYVDRYTPNSGHESYHVECYAGMTEGSDYEDV